MADAPFTTVDFHNVVQKQILNAVIATLAETKLDWAQVAPFLATARDICRADYAWGPKVQLYAETEKNGLPADAGEAYLGVTIADQDDGTPWLSETYWLSDVVLSRGDADHVRASVRALERTIAKLHAWLDASGG